MRNHYIIKYCINEKSLKFEYEFLLYNILNKYCSNINNFPEVPLFFKEITKYKTKNKK